jgi:hypothetical protein
MQELAFVTLAGLRGSVSLILTQALVTEGGSERSDERKVGETALFCSAPHLVLGLVFWPRGGWGVFALRLWASCSIRLGF